MKKGFLYATLLIIGLSAIFTTKVEGSISDSTASLQDTTLNNEKAELNPGDFIFDHIGDAHDWHILTIGDHHISIPLPIFLYSKTRGKFYAFFSSKFHHGQSSYKGFKLITEGDLKDKIAEIDSQGQIITTSLPINLSLKKNGAAIIFSCLLISFLFIPVAKKYKKNPKGAPKGFQSLAENFVLFVRDEIARPSIGEKHYSRFMPFLLTVFFFIWINNMLGLIPIFPGGANVTGNIAVTMVLAVFTLLVILLNGNKHFWKHIFNTPGIPMMLKFPIPLMQVVEISSWIIKPAVLMIRLFANMLAGHMISMVLFLLIFIFGAINIYYGYGISFISVLLVVFMSLLELLVAFIQAFVFTMLSALFVGMAVEDHN
ncbi:MAG: F0F1 ATP synthase subunit A [Bacteroidales bacterium]|nr:F0F1 ATP synthase subunit A [Bacteroidales bacterium]MDD3890689.1 F0F1 ATP synthase subunit A [Bacteroidales bacterium]